MARPSTGDYMPLSPAARKLSRRQAVRVASFGLAASLLVAVLAYASGADFRLLQSFARSPRVVTPGQHRIKSSPPAPRRIGNGLYSGNLCIGAAHQGPGIDGTRCHFENVCIELQEILREPHKWSDDPKWRPKQSVKMTYYRPSAALGTPHHTDRDHRIDRPWVRLHKDAYLVPEVVYSPMPEDSVWSPSDHAILQEAFWPENFGHALGDDFFPAFHLAKSFGVWDRSELQLVMHPACWQRGQYERGCAHHAEIAPYLFDRPVETSNSTLFASAAGGRVCFRNLYTGMMQLGTGFPSEDIMPQFIDELRRTAGLSVSARPRRQRITVFLKHGRRIFLNNDAIVNHLRDRFEVEVDLLDPSQQTISEQLAYLQDTSVLVSPCGGMSYGQFFLPKGASLVVPDYWLMEDGKNQTLPMEPFVFRHNNNVETYYYPLEFQDLHLGRVEIPPWDQNSDAIAYRNYADVMINLERLEKYVFSALLRAEVSYGWQNSFKINPS